MIKSGDDIVTSGFSGKLGNLTVFYIHDRKKHVYKAPGFSRPCFSIFMEYFYCNKLLLKIISTTILGGIFLSCFAQNDSVTYIFTGQILDTDSLPVENVYLVNYRNIECYATNEQGKFKIPVLPGDSLKTAHISFESIIIKACHPDSVPVFTLSFAIHHIGESWAKRNRNLKKESYELNNFHRNWNSMLKHMQNEGCFCSRGGTVRRSDSEGMLIKDFGVKGNNPSLSLSPEAIYKKIKRMNLIRKQRKQRKAQKE